MQKLVIASNNAGKLRELGELLAVVEFEPVPQSAFNVPEVDEPHPTFIENALAKARHASRIAGLPALSDDSGICVDVLNGQPGVHSARFAGEPKSDQRNNEKLMQLLAGKADRRAHYYCVIVMVRNPDDPQPLIAEGIWHGKVIDTPRGTGGFGYDPYFYLPSLRRTVAELEASHKNSISHRGLAMQSFRNRLLERW
jgi:XTP/dITP diphosphohydrolase